MFGDKVFCLQDLIFSLGRQIRENETSTLSANSGKLLLQDAASNCGQTDGLFS
jgi:hypothetical protein